MKYDFFKLNEITPKGFLLKQLKTDFEEGVIQGYENIVPNVDKKLFIRQASVAGTTVMGNRGMKEKTWWPGEHEGYYFDALFRNAVLLNDENVLNRIHQYVEEIKNTFRSTGYVGIYNAETRFPKQGYDGELWTQSRIFQMLLSYSQCFDDSELLNAVIKTVRDTYNQYKDATYFGREGCEGGVNHGVGYFDTLEYLFRITGDFEFIKIAKWLYQDLVEHREDFSEYSKENMLSERKWFYHTPHLAESLHCMAILSETDSEFSILREQIKKKLTMHTNPGGGFTASEKMEAVNGVLGSGDNPTEYCSKTESISSLARANLFDLSAFYGDYIEKCFYNTAQSGRLEVLHGVLYLSRDNQYAADDELKSVGREIFSCCHKAALCCALNSMRIVPYFTEAMFLKNTEDKELVVNLYGPVCLTTEFCGKKAEIEQVTRYPFENKVLLKIKTSEPIEFCLKLRAPFGIPYVSIDGKNMKTENGFVTIRKIFSDDFISLEFDFPVRLMQSENQRESYYQWGSVVFALPIPSEVKVLKQVGDNAYDYTVSPLSETDEYKIMKLNREFTPILYKETSEDADFKHNNLKLSVEVTDGQTVKKVFLEPMSKNLLRKTTFFDDDFISEQNADMSDDSEHDQMRYF